MTCDIPVFGWKDQTRDVFEMVKEANRYYKDGQYELAAQLYRDAVDVGNNDAMYRLAHLLKEHTVFSLSKQERFKQAEYLLLKLCTRHTQFQNQIDMELADLYYRVGNKNASALGHLLRAKRNGHYIDDKLVDSYQKQLLKQPIDLSSDPHGAFLLGESLRDIGSDRAIYFLEQSIEFGGKQSWVSFAVLDLADCYRGKNELMCRKYLSLAAELGNPEILRKACKISA